MNSFSHRSSLACLLALAFFALVSVKSQGAAVNETFPDVTAFGLEGDIPSLKGKVVLVDFFASWCGPCKASFPVMQELRKQFAGKDFIILAVNLDDKKEDMQEFLSKHPADFSIVRDVSKKLVETVKIKTMPTSFILDRDGKVRAVHKGFKGDETKRQYIEQIESLLK